MEVKVTGGTSKRKARSKFTAGIAGEVARGVSRVRDKG